MWGCNVLQGSESRVLGHFGVKNEKSEESQKSNGRVPSQILCRIQIWPLFGSKMTESDPYHVIKKCTGS